MNRRLRSLSPMRPWMMVALSVLAAAQADSRADPVRIMPLGDSITEARDGYAAYRYWLWKDLEAAGHSVDFVGSRFGVYNGSPPYTDYDQDHEGHWGWRADEILANIGAWSAAYTADIVLIHLGHNDLWQNQSVAGTIGELGAIIDTIRVANPNATFLLAQIISSTATYWLDSIPALNAGIPALAESKHRDESPVLVVDQHTGFDPWNDTYDGVHPNESGERKIAAKWFAPLDSILMETTGVRTAPAPGGMLLRLVNFPNPFNPATTFHYSLPERGNVRLTIHDIRGRWVATLDEGTKEAGDHRIVWNPAGRSGSGMCFARLETPFGVLARKIIILE